MNKKRKRYIIIGLLLVVFILMISYVAANQGFGEEKNDDKLEVVLGEEEQLPTEETIEEETVEEEEVIEEEEVVEEEVEEEELTVAEQEGVSKVSKTMYASGGINIREDATTDSDLVGYYNDRAKVKVTGEVGNGWVQVDFNGDVGYVHGSRLVATKPAPPQQDPAPSNPTPAPSNPTPAPSEPGDSGGSGWGDAIFVPAEEAPGGVGENP